MTFVLSMNGIRKSFGATIALAGVDLNAAAGEVLALVGENGAGKSTLMKTLSGAYKADAGEMFLEGQPYHPANPHAARHAGVCMIYQELSLAPHLSVEENILLGIEPRRFGIMDWKTVRKRAADALAELGHKDIDPRAITGSLSIARQQMVEIARAIASGCKVLVLDEPTSSLAAKDIERLFHLIRTLKDRGCAVIYISHILEEVREISQRVTVLRDGKSVGGGATSDLSDSEIVKLMAGRDVEELYPRTHRQRSEPIMSLENLSGKTLPRDASLVLHRGEVFGIAGLIGSGRTELLRAIFGLDPVAAGAIKVEQISGPASPAVRWNQAVGMVSEDRKREGLALNLSIEDNLVLSQLRGLGPPGFVLPRKVRRTAREWIQKSRVKCRETGDSINTLSGGNQQKVAIARLLHHDCDVLLLDEPTRGIDVGAKAEIYRTIDDLARQGKAVLMVSSYLPELLGVCDRIAVMSRGRLGPAHPVGEVDELSLMTEATKTS